MKSAEAAPISSDGRWLKWGFVAPTLLFLVALNVFPLLFNVILSFTDAHLLSESSRAVGGANYSRAFESSSSRPLGPKSGYVRSPPVTCR